MGRAVSERLEADSSPAGIGEALQLFCEHLDVARVSLHAIDGDAFRVLGGAGGEILAPGTMLPLNTSTQVLLPAQGEVFLSRNFRDDDAFDRPLDHLVMDMDYQSGCSIPLFLGARPVGMLCATSRNPDLDAEPVLHELREASVAAALAVHRPSVSDSRVLICVDDDLLANGIARIVERAVPMSADIYSRANDLAQTDLHQSSYEAIICDTSFDGVPVDTFLASLRSSGTNGPALVLATKDSAVSRSLARSGGAAAYLARSAGAERLASAVGTLISGRAAGVVPRFPVPDDDDAVAETEIPRLTGQELRILVLLDRGLLFKQIARELEISESTAKGYARNLSVKLGAHSRSEAVYVARSRGLLDFLP